MKLMKLMKHTYRGFLSLCLVVCLLSAYVMPFGAWAATPDTEEDIITYTDGDMTEGNNGVPNIPDETLAAEVAEKQAKAQTVRDAYNDAFKNALKNGEAYNCPMCGTENAQWTKMTTGTGDKKNGTNFHYYIDSSFQSHTGVNLAQVSAGSTTMCFALIDANLTTTGRIHVGGTSTWNFMGEGTITTNGKDAADCGLFTVNGSPTLNLYGGTYLNTSYGNTADGNTYGANANLGKGTIHAYQSGTTVNMFDGVVVGPETADPSYELVNAVAAGTFNMYGGTMHNSVANGTNAGVIVTGTFNMYGGNITGGQGKTNNSNYAGNIYNKGTFKMYGGTISNGSATNGGNIYMDGGTLDVYGGEITGGTATSCGGNIFCLNDSTVNINGGKITGGIAGIAGGNISGTKYSVKTDGSIELGSIEDVNINMTAGEISNGVANGTGSNEGGGNIFLFAWGGSATAAKAKINITGGTVKDGQGKKGGNIYLRNSAVLLLGQNGKISGGKATATDGADNIHVWNAAAAVISGTVTAAADATHYNIYVSYNANLWLKDSAIIDGQGTNVTSKSIYSESGSSNPDYLVIDSAWTGEANVILNGQTATDGAAVANGVVGILNVTSYGANTREQDTSNTYTGKLKLVDKTQQMVIGTLNGVNGELVYYALGEEFNPAENEGSAYCEACKKIVQWTPYADTSGNHAVGHYYLAGDATYSTEGFQVVGNACFHTNGYTLSPKDSTSSVGVYATGTLNIMGNGTVIGGYNGAIYLNGGNAGSKTNVYGGTFKSGTVNAPVVWINTNGGTFTLHDGTIDAAKSGCAMYIDGQEGGKNNAAFIINGGQIINGDSWVRTPVASISVNGGTVDGYIGTGTKDVMTGSLDNITAGSGYTKYNVDNKVVIANAYVETFGPGWISIDVEELTKDVRVNTCIKNATGTTALTVEILDADGNVLTTVTPESYNVGDINTVNICAMVLGDSGSWQQDKEFTVAAVPASAKLYVNNMSVPVKNCIIKGADQSAQLTAEEWARYFNMEDNLFAVTDTDYCYGLFTSLEEAQDVATEGRTIAALKDISDVIKLSDDATIDLNGFELTVDLNGNSIEVNGTGTFIGSDTANDEYDATACGKVIAGADVEVVIDNTVDGKRYIALKNEDASYSYHRLEVAAKYVTIRTTETGFYYKSTFKADDVLLAATSQYGVVLSLANMPGADWESENNSDINIATVVNASEKPLDSNQTVTSGGVFGIMKDTRSAELNAQYGKMNIYVNPYLIVDGNIIMCDTENIGKTVDSEGFNGTAYSLFSALKKVNDNWNNSDVVKEEDKSKFKAYYNKWASIGMSQWANELPNISGANAAQ